MALKWSLLWHYNQINKQLTSAEPGASFQLCCGGIVYAIQLHRYQKRPILKLKTWQSQLLGYLLLAFALLLLALQENVL